MKITEEISLRIDALRFPMIVGIVLFHANQTNIRFSYGVSEYALEGIPAFITNLITEASFVALPFFFLVSGLLFFKDFQPTLAVYRVKLRTRVRTLLVPYLFWNICLFSALLVVHEIGPISYFFSNGKMAVPENGVYAILNTIIGIDRMPIVYPLWFIRDLMLLMIISPLFWVLAKRGPLSGLLIFAFLWFTEGWLPLIIFTRYAGPLFFYCGCLMAAHDPNLGSIERLGTKILIIFGCGVVLSALIRTLNTPDVTFWWNPGAANVWQVFLTRATRLVGLVALWSVAGFLGKKALKYLAGLSAFVFIVFAGHEPTLTIFRKLLYRFVPPSGPWGILLYYFLTVIASICMMILLGTMLGKYMPGFYNFITGSRSREDRDQAGEAVLQRLRALERFIPKSHMPGKKSLP
jgi:surface polysaccharide O-acyltransferase-like enzyme